MLSPGRGYCNKTANARASGITGREVYRARAPVANFSRDLTPPSASTTSVRRVSDLGGWHRVLKVKTRLKSNEKNEPLARCQSVFALAPATQRSASAAACAIDDQKLVCFPLPKSLSSSSFGRWLSLSIHLEVNSKILKILFLMPTLP